MCEGPLGISIRLEYKNELIEDFPKENEWQNYLSKIGNIRVKFLRIKGQTLKCTLLQAANEDDMAGLQDESYIANEDYLLKFEMEKDTVFYIRPSLDLDGSQIEGQSPECICLDYEADTEIDWFSTMLLIATNTDGVEERVGCTDTDDIHCLQGGKWEHLAPEVYLGMVKKKLQLRTILLG